MSARRQLRCRRYLVTGTLIAGGSGLIAVGLFLARPEPAATAHSFGTVTSARTAPAPTPDVVRKPHPATSPPVRHTTPPQAPPVRLVISAENVSAPVVPIGTTAQGGLALPPHPRTVGWWVAGAEAGGRHGTTVIAGHVDSAVYGLGALSVLRTVSPGEQVRIIGADHRTYRYRITARREYRKAGLPATDIFRTDGAPRLILITCGGRFDSGLAQYEDNIVVYAAPEPSAIS